MPEKMRASITSSIPSLNDSHRRSKPGFVGLAARIGPFGTVAKELHADRRWNELLRRMHLESN
jgi:hypothetical protein